MTTPKPCPHITLRKKLVGNFHWYQCECGQKFKAEEWDGRVQVISEKPGIGVEEDS